MIALSHRGLDLDQGGAPGESTSQAFADALKAGYGLEIDLQMCADGTFLIWHDYDLQRWSSGQHSETWAELSDGDIQRLETQYGKLCRWSELMELHARYPQSWIAVHLKARNQNDRFLEQWQTELKKLLHHQRILVFDLYPSVARELRATFSDLGLAVSACHPYDVQRFSDVTGQTLLTVEEALQGLRGVCDWLWLDEWDRKAREPEGKNLYSNEVVKRAQREGFKLAAISPELHKSEGHEDALTKDRLTDRWRELKDNGIDAICTDYPTRLMESLGASAGGSPRR